MEDVEATIFDGDTVLMSGIPVLLDVLDVPAGSSDGSGWHAHAALPLGLVLEPGEQMLIETTDVRSGPGPGDGRYNDAGGPYDVD